MELTVLGCGDAFGNGGRHHTSFHLSSNDEGVLLDCGASTLIRLKHEKISLESISTIVISHFHGDHYGGIPFFMISSLFEHPRKSPLTIVGPEGIKDRVYNLQETMYPGTLEKFSSLDLSFREYEEGSPLQVDDKIVRAFPVLHSPPSNPHGIRLEWRNKVVSFSGDTSWSDSLIELSKNSDLFICECNFLKGIHNGHISLEELEEKKHLLESKQIWLTHMSDEVYELENVSFSRMYEGLRISI